MKKESFTISMKSIVSSIRQNIRALVAPEHELSMPRSTWSTLVANLEQRSAGVRESGAFLLGRNLGHAREVLRFELYDDLEPGCLDSGYVSFSSAGYRELWKVLKETGLEVVADVHTHPAKAFFSRTDRTNPMMPTVGHLAFVVADYAQGTVRPNDVAFFRYLGNHEWTEHKPGNSGKKLYVGMWG